MFSLLFAPIVVIAPIIMLVWLGLLGVPKKIGRLIVRQRGLENEWLYCFLPFPTSGP